jgi:hypothetical protein
MLTYVRSNETGRVYRRSRRRMASAGALACALAFAFAAAASAQGRAPAYAGTWKCVDAVDDNDRPFSVVIKRVGNAYELDDPSQHPSRTVGGRVKRGRLTFEHKERAGTSPLVFTMVGRGTRMTEEYFSGGKRLAIHFVRASRRGSARRARRADPAPSLEM